MATLKDRLKVTVIAEILARIKMKGKERK